MIEVRVGKSCPVKSGDLASDNERGKNTEVTTRGQRNDGPQRVRREPTIQGDGRKFLDRF